LWNHANLLFATDRHSTSSNLPDLLWADAQGVEVLDESGRQGLARDIIDLVGRCNRSGDQTTIVPSEYLEIVVTQR